MANTPFVLLNSLLDSATDEEFDSRLKIHGPVKDDEVAVLISEARSAQARTRRNATAALRLTRSAEAKAALLHIAAHTSDAAQYAEAMGGLVNESNLATLVRPELLKAALSASDPDVLVAALQVAVKAHLADLEATVESALAHHSIKVRQAALEAACELYPLKFESTITTELLKEDALIPYKALYLALVHSDDTKMAEIFLRSLKLGPSSRSSNFHNAIYFSEQRKPWLRTVLLDLLKQGGELADSAFHILEKWGDSDKVPCAFCITAREQAPPASDPTYRRYMVDRERCRTYLGKLAGHAPFTWEERAAALTFAKTWMTGAGHTP